MTDNIGDAIVDIQPRFWTPAEWRAWLREATHPDHVEIKLQLNTKAFKAEYAAALAEQKAMMSRVRSEQERADQTYHRGWAENIKRQADAENAARVKSIASQKAFWNEQVRQQETERKERLRAIDDEEKEKLARVRNNNEKMQREHQRAHAEDISRQRDWWTQTLNENARHADAMNRVGDRVERDYTRRMATASAAAEKKRRADEDRGARSVWLNPLRTRVRRDGTLRDPLGGEGGRRRRGGVGDGELGGGRRGGGVFDLIAGGQRGQVVALKALSTIIAPVSAGVLGLASAFAIAGAASGIFATAVVGHIAQVTTVMKQVKEQGQQLSDLPAPFQKLLPAIDEFSKSWRQFLQDTRAPVFDVFIQGMDTAKAGLTAITPVVNATAAGFGTALSTIKGFIQGASMSDFLGVLKTDAPNIIQSLTQSLVNLSDGFLDIFTAFTPAGQSMLQMLEALTAKFRVWTAGFKDSDGFKKFLAFSVEEGPKVLDFISNLLIDLGMIVAAMAPVGSAVLMLANGFAAFIASLPQESLTAFTTALITLWAAMKIPALVGLIASLGPVTLAFIAFEAIITKLPSGAFVPLTIAAVSLIAVLKSFAIIETLRVAWAAMSATMLATAAASGVTATGFAGLSATALVLAGSLSFLELATGIGILIAAAAAVTGLVYILTKDSDEEKINALAHQTAANATDVHKGIVASLTDALIANNGALDENYKRLKLKELLDKGILKSGAVDPATALSGITGSTKDFDTTLKSLRDEVTRTQKAVRQRGQKDRQPLQDEYEAAVKAADAYAEYGGSFAEATRQSNIAKDVFGNTTDTLKDQANVLVSLTPLMDAYNKAIAPSDAMNVAKAYQTTYKTLTDAHKTVTDAIRDQALTAERAKKANTSADEAVIKSKEHLSDVVRTIAQDNADAAQKVVDSEKKVADASAASKKAVLDLAQARKDAVKALRDQADAEESTSIRLEQAKLEVLRTSTRDPADLVRRQALLGFSEAQKADADTRLAGKDLKAKGVEGAPGVVSAKKDVADTAAAKILADKDLTRAISDNTVTQLASWRTRRDAQNDVNKAIDNQRITLDNGVKTNADALQASNDATDAERVAQGEYDKSRAGIDAIATSLGLTSDEKDALAANLAKGMSLNVGNVPAQLNTILVAMEAMHLLSTDTTGKLTSAQAWAQAVANVKAASSPAKPQPTIRTTLPNGNVHVSGPGGSGTQLKAMGGGIFGGSGTRDDVPAMLTAGEHVWTKEEVRAAGGHSAMETMRKGFRRFAAGGKVIDISKLPVADNLINSGILDRAAERFGFAAKGAEAGGSLGSQAIAAAAYAAGKAAGASDRVMLALFETGLVESGFKNYANSTVSDSMKLPHDAVGSDHDSVGFLQQRAGWGSVAQRMNATYAANKFLQKAMRYDKDFNGSAGQLAQKVQVSAFPDRYDAVASQAMSLIQQAVAQSIGKVSGAQHYTVNDVMNGLLSGATGGGTGGTVGGAYTGFPAWPKNDPPNLPHVNTGIWKQVVALVKASGIPSDEGAGGNYQAYNPPGQIHWHTTGRAVDFMGANQNKLGDFFLARQPHLLELIHRTKTRDYGVSRGVTWDYGANSGVLDSHRNHLHVAMDSGGILPPRSTTLVDNNTNRAETVRTGEQEDALHGGRELSPQTIQRLASAIARALAEHPMKMSGKVVTEVVNSQLGLGLGDY